jgi:hypothetical protein
LHAGLAADAALVVEIDNAIAAAKQRYGGANFYARRVVAVITAQHGEMAPRVGIVTLFYVFDPGAVNTNGNIVFFLACDRTRMATDAAVLIDEKSVAHLLPFQSEK